MMCPDVGIKYHWTPAALHKLQTPGLLTEMQTWEACLWTSYSPPSACSDSAPRAHVLPHPHPLWHCPDTVPMEQSPGSSPQLELCRTGISKDCGIFGHGSLPVHPNSHPGPALNFQSSNLLILIILLLISNFFSQYSAVEDTQVEKSLIQYIPF